MAFPRVLPSFGTRSIPGGSLPIPQTCTHPWRTETKSKTGRATIHAAAPCRAPAVFSVVLGRSGGRNCYGIAVRLRDVMLMMESSDPPG
ncbi:hypothetical protein GW17_00027129 [Ensete ventricosum]|nr:hypothetical protein GW17_00027129 [Ensete ventricosum]